MSTWNLVTKRKKGGKVISMCSVTETKPEYNVHDDFRRAMRKGQGRETSVSSAPEVISVV